MNRRTFFPWFTGGLSGSFVLGALGGASIGATGAITRIAACRPYGKLSYAQQGEDLIVDSICDSLGIQNPTYLDIGAADPVVLSNTYLFYQKGCRGVLVEPNPAFCRRLQAQRPEDKLLCVGVGAARQGSADYYMIGGPDGDLLNTFSKDEADHYAAKSNGFRPVEKVIKMPLVDINTIIEERFYQAPNFVNIDTEGLDLDILRSLDFNHYRPGIICSETLIIGTTQVNMAILDLMRSKDYSIRGSTFVNTIFVDNHLLI
jgi:FkbM family methyltransferase